MFLGDPKNVSLEVLRYLLRHPNAQDTLEGISEWWILEERIIQKYAEVQQALKKLVEQGFVLEKQMPQGRVIYCLNKKKKNLIKEFIGSAENFK